jgi:diadenosine tetraphosphate (Ap4A) HIT family hydrolase
VPSRRETRDHARRIVVTYETDSPRSVAKVAAQKYAEVDFRHNTFTYLEVRVRTDRGTFDVVVRVAAARPGFHAEKPVQVEMSCPPCPFCDSARVHLAESSLAFAFEDEHPVSLGHALIVTRRHVATYFDCTADEKTAIWRLVDQVQNAIVTLRAPDGFNVGFNAGIAAGQTVPHMHVHVIPRYAGDVDDPRGGIRGAIPGKQNYQEVAT